MASLVIPRLLYMTPWLFLAGRLWWTLRYGLSDVRVLSGGIERWVKEGHVLTKDPTPLPTEPTVFNY